MQVEIAWSLVADDKHDAWRSNRALYAYLHPRQREILYIGKADGTTVRARFTAPDKMRFWRDLERGRRIYEHRMLIGLISTKERLTRQLLADVESILIFSVQPWGNVSATRSRIFRPGLVVRNVGRHWTGPRLVKDTEEHVEFW